MIGFVGIGFGRLELRFCGLVAVRGSSGRDFFFLSDEAEAYT